ncbi:hypothetical protein RMATCC62417_02267 [Rhizopus microsporus]|nr:hypothetical protein RMATCC62417_02267 [Rhizopus microsporus]
MCYEKGLGVEKNLHEALVWFECASLAGCRNSYQHLVQLLLRYCLEHASIIQRAAENSSLSNLLSWFSKRNGYPLRWISGYAAPAA